MTTFYGTETFVTGDTKFGTGHIKIYSSVWNTFYISKIMHTEIIETLQLYLTNLMQLEHTPAELCIALYP